MFRAAGLEETRTSSSLVEAVRTAYALARELREPGDPGYATVLLSPAAASFDMFVDYAARGRAFTEAVVRLADERLEEIEG